MDIKNILNELKKNYWSDLKECISDLKTKGRRKKQIPNILTASRIISPLFIIPCALTGNLVATVILTCSFAITDCFDGLLARKLNATSDFGKELDPIADKVFASSILIPLIKYNPTILISTLLELTIAAINSTSKIKGNNPKTNLIGKIKTWALSLLIIANYYTLFVSLNQTILTSLLAITTILQLGSAAKYLNEDIEKDKIKKETNTQNIQTKEVKKKNKISAKQKMISILKTEKNCLENKNKEINNYKKTLHK